PLVCQAQRCVVDRDLVGSPAILRQTNITEDNGRRQRILAVKVGAISSQSTRRAEIDGAVIGHPHRAVERDLISNESVSPRNNPEHAMLRRLDLRESAVRPRPEGTVIGGKVEAHYAV